MSWEFWIDRGGTFTDCIGVDPDGRPHVAKVLSTDDAPAEAIRQILERNGVVSAGGALPACRAKVGSTVATNALLERRGVATCLVADRGLGDVLTIGTQERPDLFDLDIRKPAPLHTSTAEVGGRVSIEGEVLLDFDADAARAGLEAARRAGASSVAIVLVHAYAHPAQEQRLCALAVEQGFDYVVASHEVAREQGLLARGETTAVDAYLTPLLRGHVASLERALPDSTLRFMQSSGGLTTGARFRGPNALLSGPAGGVVGASRVAAEAGFERAIGFDMGGTSTDVSLIQGGEVDRSFETVVGGVRVRAPMLRIHTVAAGGGSLCRFDGFRFTVGPESAGASPGPLCYGSPDARELAVTDVNLALGRIQGDRFPFDLDREAVMGALSAMAAAVSDAGFELDADGVAAGFVEVANASMARAIAEVSVSRGVDPRDCALVGFGGAGGQHVCAIARSLGMRDILLHPFAGILSAYGIGLADTSWDGTRDAGRVALPDAGLPSAVEALLATLAAEGRAALAAEKLETEAIVIEPRLDLRYVGTETALAVAAPASGTWHEAFERAHRMRFGYVRAGRAVEITTARVRAFAPGAGAPESGVAPSGGSTNPEPLRRLSVWFPDLGRVAAPVYLRDALAEGAALEGPALILEDTGTVVLDPGFRLEVGPGGLLHLVDEAGPTRPDPGDLSRPDPVRLEVFGSRCMSIAEQMGAVLRNTSVSTNIKERLDYSCAVFDAEGGLVANAPHIPVHLGAMGETVRCAYERFPDLEPGDVVVTNDPFAGGSHLPDVTLVTPVFTDAATPSFFVASRGHHADIGGMSPGSMPANSRTLEEEGVLIEPFRVVRAGHFEEARLREILTGARYPARAPDDNVAELEAMVAANEVGGRLLRDWCESEGELAIATTMGQLQDTAAAKVRHEIARLPDGEHRFEDRFDDGTPIQVTLDIHGDTLSIDFEGTGAVHPGNLNAPRAVVQAAVLYVLRALVDERIPLNGGCLEPVTLHIPENSLLDPPPGSAVVGGNVETSQRIVDVLLGAIGRLAASQGTMNNVAFGDASFGYYETIGGGAGAGRGAPGASGVHTHMTNTRITDPEVFEARHPVRLLEFSLRRGSGGAGAAPGGDGLVRGYEFLAPVTLSLLTERRARAPFGLEGGAPGAPGRNSIERAGHGREVVGSRATLELEAGDRLWIETPGGGGFGVGDKGQVPGRNSTSLKA
jgi:5-oxoprolinase (ATP-hydrolysing)